MSTLEVFLTDWCPYCRALVADLDRAQIAYTPNDVDRDAAAADFVRSVNGGNRVVPTVRFADGRTLTNPPLEEIVARLG